MIVYVHFEVSLGGGALQSYTVRSHIQIHLAAGVAIVMLAPRCYGHLWCNHGTPFRDG